MSDRQPSRLRRLNPFRDWRPAAAAAALGAVLLVGASFWIVVQAKNDTQAANRALVAANDVLQDKVDLSSAVADCRSAAASFHEEAKGVVIERLADVVVAAVRHLDLAAYSVALEQANANARAAQRARADAVEKCAADPGYRIDPSILTPIVEPVSPD